MKNKIISEVDPHPFYTAHKHKLSPQKYNRLVNALMSYAGSRAALHESSDQITASFSDTGAFHDELRGIVRSATFRRSTSTGYEKRLSSPGLVFRNGSSPVAVRKMEVTRLCRLESSKTSYPPNESHAVSSWLLEQPFGLDGLWTLTLEDHEY